MKLNFTRRTWYFALLASAALTLLNGLAVLAGRDLSFLETCAFCAAGMAALFLAASKGAPKREKQGYFAAFALMLFSYICGGAVGYICLAMAWPLILFTEYKRGARVERQLGLVSAAEAMHLLFVLAAVYFGASAMRFWANIMWILLAIARGWAALSLMKAQEEE